MPTRAPAVAPPDSRHPSPEGGGERVATLPVVDPHVRLGTPPPDPDLGIDPLAPLRPLFDRRGGCHLLRAVHVQDDLDWDDALADVARVQAIARTPGSGGVPHGIVACCDLVNGDVSARLDALTRHPNVRGVHPPAWAGSPTDLASLARHDLLLELRVGSVPISDVVWLASAHPDCRLVLEDSGSRGDGTDGCEGGANGDAEDDARRRADWRRLGPHGNVFLKLGHRETFDPRSDHERLGARLTRALEAVGPERVMLASGFSTTTGPLRWSGTWRAFAVAARGITARRRNALFRTNAIRIYRL